MESELPKNFEEFHKRYPNAVRTTACDSTTVKGWVTEDKAWGFDPDGTLALVMDLKDGRFLYLCQHVREGARIVSEQVQEWLKEEGLRADGLAFANRPPGVGVTLKEPPKREAQP